MKISEIQSLSPYYNLICITETHIDQTFFSSQLFNDTDKNIYRKDRNINGGGVLIAIDCEIPHMTILSCQEETCEIIGINVKLKSLDLTVICFYRPDKNIDDMDPFYRYINTIRIAHPKNKFLILGDFNMPDIDWQRKINFPSTPTIQNVFVSFLNDQNLEQLIKVPTHVKGNILDILCTDLGSLILDTEVISPGLSDHFLVTARIVGKQVAG